VVIEYFFPWQNQTSKIYRWFDFAALFVGELWVQTISLSAYASISTVCPPSINRFALMRNTKNSVREVAQ